MSGAGGLPYWRLAAFYCLYFAALGAFMPYWGLYLESQGFSPEQIGQLMAVVAVTKIFAPNLWAWIADRTGAGLRLIRLASFAAFIGFFGFFWWNGFWWLCLGTLLFSFFWNACLPLFEALTLRHLGPNVRRYARIRLWGSVGFIASVVLVGRSLGTDLMITCLPQLVCALLVGTWLASLATPPVAWAREIEPGSFWQVVRRREVVAFFVVIMLVQMSHGPYYVFFSIYLEQRGLPGPRIGQLWALGVVAEIVLFLFMGRILGSVSLRGILLASLVLSAVRWWLIGWSAPDGALLVLAQVLHAASFGCTHAVGIQLTHQYFAGAHRSKGQGLYSSASFGLGGALGSLLAGQLWVSLGPRLVYSAAAGICLLAWLIAWRGVERRSSHSIAVTR